MKRKGMKIQVIAKITGNWQTSHRHVLDNYRQLQRVTEESKMSYWKNHRQVTGNYRRVTDDSQLIHGGLQKSDKQLHTSYRR